MNPRDLAILAQLRNNGRAKLTDISNATKIPLSTVHERFNALKPFINRHVILPDFKALGFPIRMMYAFKASKDITPLVDHAQLNTALVVANDANTFLELFFRTPAEADEFEEQLKNFAFKPIRVIHVIQDLKREALKFGIPSQHIPSSSA